MASAGHPRLEVPIFGPGDGSLAASLGASRLELNRAGSYALGGTTPTLAELTVLLSSFTNPHTPTIDHRPTIRIMIRPRGPPPSSTTEPAPQDFIYAPDELSTMAASIKEFASSCLLSPEHGDGFVFGILKRDSGSGRVELDVERNRALVALALSHTTPDSEEGGGVRFKCVLHRAVDHLLTGVENGAEVKRVMEEVKECGFDGVLTSGGRGRAVDNIGKLGEVVGVAGREGVEVIVGGGVRRENLRGLMEGLGDKDGLGEGVWFHSSCLGSEERFDEQEAESLAEEMRDMKLLLS